MSEEDVTPPILQGPGDKERRYDRQLRLWAAQGQAALEVAAILLINSGPGVVGVETLKNLVLPGVRQCTILDPNEVSEADLGVNFFVVEEDLGKSRAIATSKFLEELNPDVQVHRIIKEIDEFLAQPGALKPFSHILVVLPLSSHLLDVLLANAKQTNTPTFFIHSIGFYGSFTVQLPPAFPIVDTHPDPETTTDLRLLEAWPELEAYAQQQTVDLDHMDDDSHGHVPYVLLLLHYLHQWRKEHNGSSPSTYQDKTAFRDLVRSGCRTSSAGDSEENYDEAVAAVLKTLNPSTPSSVVREILSAPECKHLTSESPSFWIIANAISIFYAKHKVLPLPGSLPDMKAKSSDYINLQQIYKSKARTDAAEIMHTVRALEEQHSVAKRIPQAEIDAFCKSAAYIRLLRGRDAHIAGVKAANPSNDDKPVTSWGDRQKWVADQIGDKDSLMFLYIAIVAYDAHVGGTRLNSEAHVPRDEDWQYDPAAIMAIAEKIFEQLGVRAERDVRRVTSNYIEELVRAKGGELHNTASLLGGMVAQEVIKVITGQYIPIDNTVVWDGVRSRAEVFKL